MATETRPSKMNAIREQFEWSVQRMGKSVDKGPQGLYVDREVAFMWVGYMLGFMHGKERRDGD